MKRFVLIFLFLFQFPTSVSAIENNNIRVIFSSYTQPYVFENGTGIVVDIVKESLELSGYKVIPVFLPIGRGFKMFEQRQVEATSIIKKNSGLKNAYYSDYFMQYHNYAITRKNGPRVEALSDLAYLDVVAFQNASLYLGKLFGETVKVNKNYKELANQEIQTLMLLNGRTQVAVMDEAIFKYFRNKLLASGRVKGKGEVIFNDIFKASKYRTAFIDKQVKDDFNKGLKILHNKGRYKEIYNYYIRQYFTIKQ